MRTLSPQLAARVYDVMALMRKLFGKLSQEGKASLQVLGLGAWVVVGLASGRAGQKR